MHNNINVEIRIKPALESSLETTSNTLLVGTKKYNFNKVHITTTQKQIFEGSIKNLLTSFTNGFNCTVLAYGQTGSGKTYTMGISPNDTSGIVPQSLEYLFNNQINLSCTFVEVYNEDVIDLLSDHKIPLNIRESKGDIFIAGATEIFLKDYEDGLNILKRGCLERTTKCTKMNSESSRSHAIFTLFLKKDEEGRSVTSRFSFVDLAGSERLKRTLCVGERVKESISINGGLLALGNVISALYKKFKHVPFRDSKLTRILQSCLNGHVLMIACISALHTDMNETNNTLKYANRAASIQLNVRKNVEVDNSKMEVIRLRKEINKLRNENQILKERIKKSGYLDTEKLSKEIRILKNKLEYQIGKEDKSEDLAQEIIKHPFVQNLINENEKLKTDLNLINNNLIKVDQIKIGDQINHQIDSNKMNNQINIDKQIDQNKIDQKVDKQIKINQNNHQIDYKIDQKVENKQIKFNNQIDQKVDKQMSNTNCSNTGCSKTIFNTNFNIKNNERDNIFNIKNNESNKLTWIDKKHATFDISPPKKKSTLWTPRKEKVLMDTSSKYKISGYLPSCMNILDDKLIFSSLDNKVRIFDKSVYELFTDSGVRCLEVDDNIYYSTRMILKQYDKRIKNTSPLSAYKSEISCICKDKSLVYTGHEDGTLNILDIRNMSIKNDKLHSGTIFSILLDNKILYTASRDHNIKMVFSTNNKKTLFPPHYDNVQSLLIYKNDLISLSRDCALKRWKNGEIVKTVPNAHSSWIKCGTSLKDCFVTGSKNGTIRYWDYCDNSVFCVGSYKINGSINCMVRYRRGIFIGSQNKEINYIESVYNDNL